MQLQKEQVQNCSAYPILQAILPIMTELHLAVLQCEPCSITRAPARARACATASPIPEVDPVTRARLPASSAVFITCAPLCSTPPPGPCPTVRETRRES